MGWSSWMQRRRRRHLAPVFLEGETIGADNIWNYWDYNSYLRYFTDKKQRVDKFLSCV